MAGLVVPKHVCAWRDVVILTTTLLALAAAPALGATVTQPPTISGDPATGSTLTASAGKWTPAGAQPNYDWLRCDAAGEGCRPVAGACDRSYTVRAAGQEQALARRPVADPLGPGPEGALRRGDRDQSHAATEGIVAVGGVQVVGEVAVLAGHHTLREARQCRASRSLPPGADNRRFR